ncbi:CAP domain-containing protein [Planotetraspora kaengkrachanensis]|uniref:SCP domain-containing protein n=1 Tax=Planotetraspora kaengkrachanensis TaxID=575193 RepID=A0A8J3M5N7_9ACTN|nr:CAP domain-containing protein [Planotetraspora kaengkrachanensis]GIG79914.1 hypothetical protein Pka01_30410 [Planotetraspora kaengkrachanensis]
MNRTVRLLGVAATAGAVAFGVPALSTPANASTPAPPRCDIAADYYDRAPAPGTGPLAAFFNMRIDDAVQCLINEERAKAGLPALTRNHVLSGAALSHARAAVNQKWWGPGADSHTNPLTGSTPASRITDAKYCPKPISWAWAETTYTGWGGQGTPRAAVHWWVYVSTAGHREIILSPSLTEMGVQGEAGAADAAGKGASGGGTYVVDFGRCQQ